MNKTAEELYLEIEEEMEKAREEDETLMSNINEYVEGEKTTAKFLKEMGYHKTKNRMVISCESEMDENDNLVIFELEDENDAKREVPFSFLWVPLEGQGVILPHPYSKYIRLKKREEEQENED